MRGCGLTGWTDIKLDSGATRRGESIHAAHAILTRAADLHPADPTVQFNLACYEAQMGSLDAKFRLMALDDPDLEPLLASLATD